jgi:dethiobiotin synthetase
MRIVAVAGTGTEVGKTFVAAGVLRTLRERGYEIAARKPVQSFSPDDATTDADELARASGAEPSDVCPPHRWLPTPLAPPMAAEALNLPPFTIADLVSEVTAGLPADGRVLIETAGGVRSPIASDGDCVDLINALEPALVVLVADAGLGTINAVRLSIEAIAPLPTVVYLNRFDPACEVHARNLEWLRSRVGLRVLTDIDDLARFVELHTDLSGADPKDV